MSRRVLVAVPPVTEPGPDVTADVGAYRKWLSAQDAMRRDTVADRGPGSTNSTVDLLLVVSKPHHAHLRECLSSLTAQGFPQWRLCVATIGSPDRELRSLLSGLGRRLRLVVCPPSWAEARAVQRAFTLTTAEVVSCIGQHDTLGPCALGPLMRPFGEGADLSYGDEDEIDVAGLAHKPRLKPAWSPDWLLSTPYLGRPWVARRALIEDVGGIGAEMGEAWEYDLMLRLTERARGVVHVPQVLYHRRPGPDTPPAPDALDATTPGPSGVPAPVATALIRALERRNEAGTVEPAACPGGWHVRHTHTATPRVSVIIPFRDGANLLRACVESIAATSGPIDIELLLVDNDSEEPETLGLLDRLTQRRDVRLIAHPGPFNWAAINNAAAHQATGDLLLFVNNDVEARRPGWLAPLVEHALRPEVGAVGGRLLYPSGEVQHVGIVIGMGGAAGHVLRGLPADRAGYLGLAALTRDCSAVTGACLMSRQNVFLDLGGFDERFSLDLNDVDYCLRLQAAGFRVIFTPLAELVHHESPSRGSSGSVADIVPFLERWSEELECGDPFLNPHLTRTDGSCALRNRGEKARWDQWKAILESSLLT